MSSFALDSLRLTPLVGFDNYSTSMNRRNTLLASRIKARAPAKESTLPEYELFLIFLRYQSKG